MRLTGAGVGLREFRPEDVDDVLAIIGDDRVTSWLSFDSRDRAQAVEMVTTVVARAQEVPRQEYYLAVTRAAPHDDRLIGFARLALDGVQAAKLGYAIAADHWGHGYATEAVRTMLVFGFGTLGLHRVSAAIGPENQSSIAVVKRLGLSYEGRIRHHVRTNGQWRDSLLYSILDEDWSRATRPTEFPS
ncbi:GNAT family N-acetyltransferase [Kribbella deserti]|uniref:GNAT family N-acetyltransferase n=1 Tax=Kribbella deserti TaxID=1926257 RepID=A0ABV6QU21_9ACTN